MIGAGELSRSERFAAGPVAEAVIQHAAPPVLAVRPGDNGTEFRRVLCPVDQSEASARGPRNAVRLAQAFGARLVVLTVVPAAANWFSNAAPVHLHEEKWREEFEQFLRRGRLPQRQAPGHQLAYHLFLGEDSALGDLPAPFQRFDRPAIRFELALERGHLAETRPQAGVDVRAEVDEARPDRREQSGGRPSTPQDSHGRLAFRFLA